MLNCLPIDKISYPNGKVFIENDKIIYIEKQRMQCVEKQRHL